MILVGCSKYHIYPRNIVHQIGKISPTLILLNLTKSKWCHVVVSNERAFFQMVFLFSVCCDYNHRILSDDEIMAIQSFTSSVSWSI